MHVHTFISDIYLTIRDPFLSSNVNVETYFLCINQPCQRGFHSLQTKNGIIRCIFFRKKTMHASISFKTVRVWCLALV